MSQQLPRLFLPPEQFRDLDKSEVTVTGSQSDYQYLHKVLRANVGDLVILLDGMGKSWYGQIDSLRKGNVSFKITGECCEHRESPVNLVLAQSLIKKDNFELVLQKGTELGINEFYPLISNRTEINLDKSKLDKKIIRWQEIVKNAAQQCKRQILPQIHSPIALEQLFADIKDQNIDFCILCHEDENTPLKQVLNKYEPSKSNGLILVGPEGGFSDSEVDIAQQNGATLVSLGDRILRTETAGITVASIIQYELGDLGNARRESYE